MVTKLRPYPRKLLTTAFLFAAGAGVTLVGGEELMYWWNSQPQDCLQKLDYGSSSIHLDRRDRPRDGVQYISLNPTFFLEENNKLHQINNTHPNCSPTLVYIKYYPSERYLAVVGNLDSTQQNLPPSYRWGAGSFNIDPLKEHNIGIIWIRGEVLRPVIDGKQADFLNLETKYWVLLSDP